MNPLRVAVIGGGVAGLSTAWHLLELWEAAGEEGRDVPPLELHLVAQLVPHAESEGSGLGGKAMSRHFEGRHDLAHGGLDRAAFYGPMLPWAGTVPHGYHILWEYPNLRRMLREPGEGDDLGGMLRPPGGAGVIASFQGDIGDPTPGGPGIGLMGLVDPDRPETAFRPVTRELLALRGTAWAGPFLSLFERLFEGLSDGIDPFSFADLFYAHEVDLELRLALILASLSARTLDPERATVTVDGVARPLTEVEYEVWAERLIVEWASQSPLRGVLPEEALDGLADGAGELGRWLLAARARFGPSAALLESLVESRPFWDELVGLLPDAIEDDVRRWLRVWSETERVVRAVPFALARLAAGDYPVWRTLHFRFAPDATFASPYSFDAAQAARSLAFCFVTPRASRMWSPDGGRIQRLWLRFWRRIEARAAALGPRVSLQVHEGRAWRVEAADDGTLGLTWGGVLGHGHGPGSDLSYPHVASLDARWPGPADPEVLLLDACVPSMGPGMLEPLLDGPAFAAARAQVRPLADRANETLELLLWLREPVDWSAAAREGMAVASITGLEGPFCLLADYRCGLWSEEMLAKERPFGPDEPFAGSLLETCGGFQDLYACLDRADAFGWPAETKAAIRDLLHRPEHFSERDARPWPGAVSDWHGRRADGTWTDARAREGWDDWVVASRWLVWGWLAQLATIQSLGPRAVRQLARVRDRLDPRGQDRAAILAPPAELLADVRYVVMRNTNRRSRFFNPGVGDWARRPVSGLPLAGAPRVFPAGDWTRNGLDVVSMEGACLSGMRAARGVYRALVGEPPGGAPEAIPVLPPSSWYGGLDPFERGGR